MLADEPFFTLSPDWVAESSSPSTRKFDRTEQRIDAR